MNKFVVTHYEIPTKKIKKGSSVRFVMLTDLHGLSFGKDNEELFRVICDVNPDAVLVTGDMIVRSELSTLPHAEKLLKMIVNQFQVYYSLGNHEYKLYQKQPECVEYMEYEEKIVRSGINILHNQQIKFTINKNEFTIYGLEIPMEYYHKPRSPKLSVDTVKELIGSPDTDSINILLAHNPKYGKTYFGWGADLILSGHYHGGVVRLGKHMGLASPQFLLFPPFCCGDFHKGESHMLVSAGLGEHTIPVRIHNPRELLVIDLKPLENL